MKTEILTKQLLEIINPFTDGIIYNGKKIRINLKELKKYVNEPKKYNVYKSTVDESEGLHKNLALYIINANDPTLIYLDINSPEIFEKNRGLFEYIKNVYTEQKTSFINLNEKGDNLLLIKSKNLFPLDENTTLEDAFDMEYLTAASAFSETPELNKKTRGQVTWKQLNSDMFGDLNYVLGKAKEIFSASYKSHNDKSLTLDSQFEILTNKINPTLLHSDEFKCGLMDLNNVPANKFFIQRFIENKPNTYFIDFSLPVFQNKLLEQIKNNDFILLSNLFDTFLNHNRYHHQKEYGERLKNTINFSQLLNQSETVDYLLEKGFSKDRNSLYGAGEFFSIVSAYPFLTEEKRTNKEIAIKYIETAFQHDTHGQPYISEQLIYKLERSLFKESSVLVPLLSSLDFQKLKTYLEPYKDSCSLLEDKNFVISVAKKVPTWRLNSWLENFFKKTDMDKEFIISLVKSNGNFFDTISSTNNTRYKEFANDFDIIRSALEGGLSPRSLPKNVLIPFLLIDHDEVIEKIKIDYLIKSRAIEDFSNELRAKGEDLEKLKDKYLKPEFAFFKPDDWSIKKLSKVKTLSTVETKDEVLEIIDKIKKQKFPYTFLASLFYESLPTPLQRDKEIFSKLLELGTIPYNSLNEALAFNCDIAIKCLTVHPESVKNIPNELFTNSNFALKFAQLMDKNHFRNTAVPSFVTKFFENQEVESNFEQHLKEHLFYTNLGADLDKPTNETPKPKRSKI